MPTLRDSIARLAEDFAREILGAIRNAPLDDIAALTGGRARAAAASAPASSGGARGGRRGRGGRQRRSRADIDALGGRIVDLLRSKPNGLRAEQIRDALGVERKELPRALAEILASGNVRKTGEKRATTYFAGEGGGRASGSKKGGKRGAKKGGKRGAKKGGKRGAKK